MRMTERNEHLRKELLRKVLQKTKAATKWLEWKILMVRTLNYVPVFV